MSNRETALAWLKERNITEPQGYKVYFTNIIEELLEPLYPKDTVKALTQTIVEDYYKEPDNGLDVDAIVDAQNDIRVFSIHDLELMGYNSDETLAETYKEIGSREQCPIQKDAWAKAGAFGKWQKWKDQPKETLYKATFKGCKL